MSIQDIVTQQHIATLSSTKFIGLSDFEKLDQFISKSRDNQTLSSATLSQYLKKTQYNPFIGNIEPVRYDNLTTVVISLIHEEDLSDIEAQKMLTIFLNEFYHAKNLIYRELAESENDKNIINAISRIEPTTIDTEDEDYI